jgi:ribonucrease Y
MAGGAVLGVMLATGVYYLTARWRAQRKLRSQSVEAESVIEQARRQAEGILRDARLLASEETLKLREQAEQARAAREVERRALEEQLSQREKLINSQLERLVEEERSLTAEHEKVRLRTEQLEAHTQELARLKQQQSEELQKLAGLSKNEAREALLKHVESEALRDANTLARHIIEEARTGAEEKARRIISSAIQRYGGEHTFENTTATIALPNGEEIKGRIIGREGRNIRAFEAATGVTVLIDDTPGSVLLSGFDPVRREIGREAMLRLIADGRIHPTRIEEVVAKVTQEMDETIVRRGEEAIAKAGIPPLHPEIVKLLGRLHFRHSFSQNLLDHAVEVAHLTGLMAAELGVEIAPAKRAGLLHDIGKAINHEVEGPHALVGADFIRRCGEAELVVNGVAAHHNEVPSLGPLGVLVSAADAISASRPGARSENMTTYLKRVEDLEKLAASYAGVEKAFAV